MVRVLLALTALLALPASDVSAQFVSPYGFSMRSQVDIRRAPSEVYDAILRIGQWWSSEHSYSGDARNMTLDARPGGCFCERLRDGGGVEHMRVIYVAPGEMLRLSGGLGPLQPLGISGTLTLRLNRNAGGTVVELTYAVGGFSEAGFNQLAPAVSSVLTEQMNRLRTYVETGTVR